MWTAQKDAFRRKVADSETENIVSTITLTFLFVLCQPSHIFRTLVPPDLFLQRLLTKLTNKEKKLSKLAEDLDFEKV